MSSRCFWDYLQLCRANSQPVKPVGYPVMDCAGDILALCSKDIVDAAQDSEEITWKIDQGGNGQRGWHRGALTDGGQTKTGACKKRCEVGWDARSSHGHPIHERHCCMSSLPSQMQGLPNLCNHQASALGLLVLDQLLPDLSSMYGQPMHGQQTDVAWRILHTSGTTQSLHGPCT